jgi:Tol biopolymer transport system component
VLLFVLLLVGAQQTGGGLPGDELALVLDDRVWRLDLDRGALYRLPMEPDVFAQGVLWSPDGTQMALTLCYAERPNAPSRCGLEIADADGTPRREVVRDAFGLGWTGDGTRLLYLALFPRSGWYTYDLRTGALSRALPASASPVAPSLTAQGTRLVYFDIAQRYLFTAEIPSGEPRFVPVPNGAGFYDDPQWSPDGAWVAYVARNDFQESPVFVSRVDGSAAPRQLTTCQRTLFPRWSPDGTRLAYWCSDGLWLETVTLDDGTITRWTRGRGFILPPIWSRDGGSLFYASSPRTISRLDLASGVIRDVHLSPLLLPSDPSWKFIPRPFAS